MNQLEINSLLNRGHQKVNEARQLLRSSMKNGKTKRDKEALLTLSKWFYENAFEVKDALQNDHQINRLRRQLLEKLINKYTVTIMEIDDKIKNQLGTRR